MRSRLQAAWTSKGLLSRLLWPVAAFFGAVLWLRRQLYAWGVFARHHLPVPVITVGNMVVGGTGKTPMTLAVLAQLRAMGRHPVVVSRGYGGRSDTPLEVNPARPEPALTGDEPLLLARLGNCPVWVGRDRVAAARAALAAHPQADTVVLDDGMQHWQLHSDVLLVLFDEGGLGNGWLLPAGPLRETWPPTTWGAATLWVQTLAAAPGHTQPLPPTVRPYETRRQLAPLARNRLGVTQPLSAWAGVRVGAVAGIAHPERFFQMLAAQGLQPIEHHALPDHADLATLKRHIGNDIPWLCTEKDAVKLFADGSLGTGGANANVWSVGLETATEPAFWAAFRQAVEGLSSGDGRKTA